VEKKFFVKIEMQISVDEAEIAGNNWFYSKACPTQRPPFMTLSEGVISGSGIRWSCIDRTNMSPGIDERRTELTPSMAPTALQTAGLIL
jgi:hypothetical protein